ncbi:uncharacterized protein LOC121739995 [Aricia agestis]|uniref:uncharacterized protein LOC121739995 n=1 Tax=Aricia agestis TaxID=91739 RepID=UPI001C2018C0|nr:uncharacterized protein LOC121739995 [Aricia agestis]
MCWVFGPHFTNKMKAILLSSLFTVLLNRTWAQYIPNNINNNIGPYPGTPFGNTLGPGNPLGAANPLGLANPLGPTNPVLNNIQVTPTLQEIVPALQFGDINMAGEMPIGGTIKVRGCFPVYGIVGVDGIVPSLGSAIVTEVIGNQVLDVVNKCANQLVS